MILLINIIFGILAGWLVYRAMLGAHANQAISLMVGVIIGIIVYLLNIAGAFA